MFGRLHDMTLGPRLSRNARLAFQILNPLLELSNSRVQNEKYDDESDGQGRREQHGGLHSS
jgi:hypothetical protein